MGKLRKCGCPVACMCMQSKRKNKGIKEHKQEMMEEPSSSCAFLTSHSAGRTAFQHRWRIWGVAHVLFGFKHVPEFNPSADLQSPAWNIQSGAYTGEVFGAIKTQQHHSSHETTAMQIKPRMFPFETQHDVSPMHPQAEYLFECPSFQTGPCTSDNPAE